MKLVKFIIEGKVGEIDKKSFSRIDVMGGFSNVDVINRLLVLNKKNNLLRAYFTCRVKVK